MPTTGPTEVLELAILDRLAKAYPMATNMTVAAIKTWLTAPFTVPATHLPLIPEVLVGLIERSQVLFDVRVAAPAIPPDTVHTGHDIPDRLRHHLLNNGSFNAIITLGGLERRDVLLSP